MAELTAQEQFNEHEIDIGSPQKKQAPEIQTRQEILEQDNIFEIEMQVESDVEGGIDIDNECIYGHLKFIQVPSYQQESSMCDQEMTIESGYISEITAVFTTANARCRLYKMMDWLDDSQMIYCDTDSVIFMCDEENPNQKNPYIHKPPKGLEFGKGLGQWEDEFDGKDWIEEIVTGGAKSYS